MARKMAATSAGGKPSDAGGDAAQKKMSVVTILRRPQDKEAAVRNMATITGRPIEVIAMQMLKSAHVVRQPFDDSAAAAADAADSVGAGAGAARDAKKADGGAREEGNQEKARPGHACAAAAKKAGGGKKKTTPLREAAARKAGPRASLENVYTEVRRLGALAGGDVQARPQSAPIHAKSVDRDARRAVEVEDKKDRTPAARRTVSDVEVLAGREAPDVVSPLRAFLSTSSGESQAVASEDKQLQPPPHAKVVQSGFYHESGSSDDELLTSCSPTKASERWAGPAYTNSPPPSTLPFPNFSIHRVKSSLRAVTLPEMSPCKSVPALPPRRCSSWLLSSAMDPSSATKDLKKILNLDVEATEKERHVFGSRDYLRDSPTRSLKRILQLS